MHCRRVTDIRIYLSPNSHGWSAIGHDEVPMGPTPLAMQPTDYIRRSWDGKRYGEMKAVHVASVHDGHTWAVRAKWTGVSPPGKDFPDAFAVTLPVSGTPVLALMGAVDAPIHILRWAANRDGARSIIATGIGLSQPGPEIKSTAKAHADGDTWAIVITRPLGVGQSIAPLAAGKKTAIGFAVWHGGNDERAGIKAFSIDWTTLALDA